MSLSKDEEWLVLRLLDAVRAVIVDPADVAVANDLELRLLERRKIRFALNAQAAQHEAHCKVCQGLPPLGGAA